MAAQAATRPPRPLLGFSEIRHEHAEPSRADFEALLDDLTASLTTSLRVCRRGIDDDDQSFAEIHDGHNSRRTETGKEHCEVEEMPGLDGDVHARHRMQTLLATVEESIQDLEHNERQLVDHPHAFLSSEDVRTRGSCFTAADRELIVKGAGLAMEHMIQRVLRARRYITRGGLLPGHIFNPHVELILEDFFAICPKPSPAEFGLLAQALWLHPDHIRGYFEQKTQRLQDVLLAGEVLPTKSTTVFSELMKDRQEERLRFDVRMAKYNDGDLGAAS